MNSGRRISLLAVLGVFVASVVLHSNAWEPLASQTQKEPQGSVLLRCLNDKEFAVRLMYWPPDGDGTYYPTIFHAVGPRDLRFGCWSFDWPRGTTVFVGAPEMVAFGEGLAKLNLGWQEFPKRMSFNAEPAEPGSPVKYKVPVPRGKGMQVDVTCQEASATAEVPPEHICTDMQSLEKAFDSLRGLYSIQLIEWEASCKVPGFDPKRLPEKQ